MGDVSKWLDELVTMMREHRYDPRPVDYSERYADIILRAQSEARAETLRECINVARHWSGDRENILSWCDGWEAEAQSLDDGECRSCVEARGERTRRLILDAVAKYEADTISNAGGGGEQAPDQRDHAVVASAAQLAAPAEPAGTTRDGSAVYVDTDHAASCIVLRAVIGCASVGGKGLSATSYELQRERERSGKDGAR